MIVFLLAVIALVLCFAFPEATFNVIALTVYLAGFAIMVAVGLIALAWVLA